jgi:hypothetical protein
MELTLVRKQIHCELGLENCEFEASLDYTGKTQSFK